MRNQPKEPIAIVGIGCRFPGGVNSPQDLYDLLINKRSGIVKVPADRWDADAFYHPDFRKPGRIHVTRGGFVQDIDKFDAAFFGISPNEAHRMDPQQRLILETALEAIEDAGARLDEIAGASIAVVIGCGSPEFHALQTALSERDYIGGATNTGSTLSIVSNRVSYVFDLRGPSFSVDTACSSSLTALHNACREIWDGFAQAALVGGANIIIRPEMSMGFSKGNYLSPDGECRAFSDDANGYVRGEGVAVVYLKRLSEAIAHGDRIYALIRGSALNQDGRTPGMTLPSREAQEQMLRKAFADAGVNPSEASYIEAHGTGTPAGDPVEATAIGTVVGKGRKAADVCYIGSVKTNVGHLECAAGMAGLIKLALVLKNRTVLPNLNFRGPNPAIPFNDLHLAVPTEPIPLTGGKLFGGVNSFGFGGANAHVVLESPPDCPQPNSLLERAGVGQIHTLFASARSGSALRQVAGRFAEFVRVSGASLVDICANAALRRTPYEFRLAVRGESRGELAASLQKYADTGELDESSTFGRAPEGHPRQVAFLFSGQGPQWWGMARQLLEENKTFQDVVARVDAELHRLGWLAREGGTLLGELTKSSESTRMAETQIAQPAIFAVQMGLAAILKEHGVVPAAVMGHSIGELAAASCAGILSIEEAARIVYWRSRSQAMAEGKGMMAAVGLSEEGILPLLTPLNGRVEIAAVNGPRAVTVSGPHDEVNALCKQLEAKDIFHRKLNVSVPFHCFLMAPIESHFREGLGSVTLTTPTVPFYSSVTGSQLVDMPLDANYWWRNIRQRVSFYQAMRSLLDAGFHQFIEIGPHPVVIREALEAIKTVGLRGNVFPTLSRPKEGKESSSPRPDAGEGASAAAVADDSANLAKLFGGLFTAGISCQPDTRGPAEVPFVALPPYPFERQRYWHETAAAQEARKKPARHLHPHIASITAL